MEIALIIVTIILIFWVLLVITNHSEMVASLYANAKAEQSAWREQPVFIERKKIEFREYRADVRVSDELVSRRLPDGYAERDLVARAINSMPLDELRAAFNIDHISPHETPDGSTPKWRWDKINELRFMREHEYRATLKIPCEI